MSITPDHVLVIRCAACTWFDQTASGGHCSRNPFDIPTVPEGFCHKGELPDGTTVPEINEEGLLWTD